MGVVVLHERRSWARWARVSFGGDEDGMVVVFLCCWAGMRFDIGNSGSQFLRLIRLPQATPFKPRQLVFEDRYIRGDRPAVSLFGPYVGHSLLPRCRTGDQIQARPIGSERSWPKSLCAIALSHLYGRRGESFVTEL